MNQPTRRQMLAGTAAAAFAAAIPFTASSPVGAAAPAAGKQAPGVYRYKVGSIEVTVIADGINRMPITDEFVLNANKDEVNAALAAAFMEKDVFVGPYNPIVVNTGAKLAVIDTGTGEAAYKTSQGANGQFLINLAAAGIDANTVDTVIISHYHTDHINGLLRRDNSLTFPNAEILVPAPEHKYWMNDGEMSRASTPRIQGLFQNVRRVMLPLQFLGGMKLTVEIYGRIREFLDRADSVLHQRGNRAQIGTLCRIAAVHLEKGRGQVGEPRIIGLLDVLRVQPFQFFRIELRGRVADRLERKPFDELLAREHLCIAMAPAEPRKVIHQCFRQVAFFRILHDADRAVAL